MHSERKAYTHPEKYTRTHNDGLDINVPWGMIGGILNSSVGIAMGQAFREPTCNAAGKVADQTCSAGSATTRMV